MIEFSCRQIVIFLIFVFVHMCDFFNTKVYTEFFSDVNLEKNPIQRKIMKMFSWRINLLINMCLIVFMFFIIHIISFEYSQIYTVFLYITIFYAGFVAHMILMVRNRIKKK